MPSVARVASRIVLPSIPGYGFSGQPAEAGWDPARIAQAWAELMHRLGYDRYVAQGGDQGASITDAMARQAPDGLAGIHLNFLTSFPLDVLAAVFGGGPVPEGLVKRVAVASSPPTPRRRTPRRLMRSPPSSSGATSSRCPSTRRRSATP